MTLATVDKTLIQIPLGYVTSRFQKATIIEQVSYLQLLKCFAKLKGWRMAPDGDKFRRVVPSPRPQHIFEIGVIELLVRSGAVVICAGGGGIPAKYEDGHRLVGVEAVIDKDLASSLLTRQLQADAFLMLADVASVAKDWGKPGERSIRKASPSGLRGMQFATGSMGPKVEAACEFVEATGKAAGIGQLRDARAILADGAGTIVTPEVDGLELA